ncbi:hypothetical protein ACGFXC_30010 [Streptomyces sp. NPDC048507]|uniref:hypothetical protein n=1 Tax=Streptomyces sp. NPDC048507 TaxID=3365560 RepID=UPI00371EA8CD
MTAPYGASTPVASGGSVLISPGNLHAVDALTGVRQWVAAVGEEASFSQPAAARSVVWAAGGSDGTLYAFHLAGGGRL